ncbi:hypothetical protein M885DRAFT_551343 [Pelagophyceae sp. CCMP2097]|nr:hypothetical protein M885DRAFT_551343 [Pelagophyceae sp. CCMP2097]
MCTMRSLVAALVLLLRHAGALVPRGRGARTGAARRCAVRLAAADGVVAQLAAAPDGAALAALVEAQFAALDEAAINKLVAGATGGDAAYSRALEAIQRKNEVLMLAARNVLTDILDAGDLFSMDKKMTESFRAGLIDQTFMLVLSMNIEAADGAKAQALSHLYTRAQEEWEKRIDPASAVLHKLTRTEQPLIRQNILEHYLAPQTVILLPNGETIPMKSPKPALVSAVDFAAAVSSAVKKLQALEGVDPELIAGNVELCRQIAKEARLVIMEKYAPEVLRQFQEDLYETFVS